jgi:hypothetical protein
MKHVVTLAIDAESGKINRPAPFMVSSRGRSHPYYDEPAVIAQFQPGERQARWRPSGMTRPETGYSEGARPQR